MSKKVEEESCSMTNHRNAIQNQIFDTSDDKNKYQTNNYLDAKIDLEKSNKIYQKNESNDEFDISSSDESISDEDVNSNEIYYPNYFLDTIIKTAEKQLIITENTESILNDKSNYAVTQNHIFKQTQSNSAPYEIKTRSIQIEPDSNFYMTPEKNNEKSIKINKQKIEEIKKNCYDNFEKVTKDEVKIIEEAKSKITTILENIENEILTKLKDPQNLSLNEVEKITKTALISIENAKNSILMKILDAKNDALIRIQDVKNRALSQIEIVKNEGIEKFNDIENCEDFGISSSDNESSSDSYVENEEDVIVPKYIVDMIIENAKIHVNQEDNQNKKF